MKQTYISCVDGNGPAISVVTKDDGGQTEGTSFAL